MMTIPAQWHSCDWNIAAVLATAFPLKDAWFSFHLVFLELLVAYPCPFVFIMNTRKFSNARVIVV